VGIDALSIKKAGTVLETMSALALRQYYNCCVMSKCPLDP
jgi:hypothetical protein